jgi:hypothetical protein
LARCDGEHRLADAERPDQQDVAFFLDEAERGELVDELVVERGLGGLVPTLP